jgi:hypothetical protein
LVTLNVSEIGGKPASPSWRFKGLVLAAEVSRAVVTAVVNFILSFEVVVVEALRNDGKLFVGFAARSLIIRYGKV